MFINQRRKAFNTLMFLSMIGILLLPTMSQDCSDGLYQWTEGNQCVEACPDGWTGSTNSDGTLSCKLICSETDDSNIWFAEGNQCVANCPPNWQVLIENTRRKCYYQCSSSRRYLWNNVGVFECVDSCPQGFIPASDPYGGDFCTQKCTGAQNLYSLPLRTCVNICPPGTTQSSYNNIDSCELLCSDPDNSYLWAENSNECLPECPNGWTGYTTNYGVLACKRLCTSRDAPIWSDALKRCTGQCPDGWMVVTQPSGMRKCYPPCRTGQSLWIHTDGMTDCVDVCPFGWVSTRDGNGVSLCKRKCADESTQYLAQKDTCVDTCPSGTVSKIANEVNTCVKNCNNQFYWSEANKCVAQCPDGWTGSSTGGISLCRLRCTGDTLIWSTELGKCVSQCTAGWKVITESTRQKCSAPCKSTQILWIHANGNTECPKACPVGWVPAVDESGGAVCNARCPDPENNIYNSLSNTCVDTCPTGATQTTLNEVSSCQRICKNTNLYLWAENNNKCVAQCSEGWTAYTSADGIKLCRVTCTGDTPIWSKELGRCVDRCTNGWKVTNEFTRLICSKPCKAPQVLWIHTDGTSECVKACPVGWVSATDASGGTICTVKCTNPANKIYYPPLSACRSACAPGTISTTFNEVDSCELICPNTSHYLWAENDNKCVTKCSTGWNGIKNADGLKVCVKKT